jgi:hypothetical protein
LISCTIYHFFHRLHHLSLLPSLHFHHPLLSLLRLTAPWSIIAPSTASYNSIACTYVLFLRLDNYPDYPYLRSLDRLLRDRSIAWSNVNYLSLEAINVNNVS